MPEAHLDIAFWNYDRTRALVEGRVTIAGVDAKYHSSRIVTELFEGMIRRNAYDVSELGFTYFLRTFEQHPNAFLAIPVFPNRAFRHSAIYVNKRRGIRTPADLAGKTIGELAVYGHDAGVMPKGILSDEYGFRPESAQWIVGGIDFPMDPIDFIPQTHPANVQVTFAKKGEDLGEMLRAGDIDALISADVPKCVLDGDPRVGRLFEHYPAVERDYYRRTGIFPIMHTVAVKRSLAMQHPELVKAVYTGFCEAKQAMLEELTRGMTFNNMGYMVPWLTHLLAENRALLGDDVWPYGVSHNRAAIEAILRYHHEQGLTSRRYTIDEIFVPALLES